MQPVDSQARWHSRMDMKEGSMLLGPWEVCMNGAAHFCRLYLFVRFSLGVGYGKDPELVSIGLTC